MNRQTLPGDPAPHDPAEKPEPAGADSPNPVSSTSAVVGDAATLAATGRTRNEWFVLLDAVALAGSAALGFAPTSRNVAGTYARARWALGEAGSILAAANPTRNGKTSVSLTHQRLPDIAAVAPAKAALQRWLAAARREKPMRLG